MPIREQNLYQIYKFSSAFICENNLDIKHLKILITNNLKDELVQFNFLHEKLPSKIILHAERRKKGV